MQNKQNLRFLLKIKLTLEILTYLGTSLSKERELLSKILDRAKKSYSFGSVGFDILER